MTAGIGDWYRNREHASDRDPTYDPATDDIRDPFAFGEAPKSRVLGRRSRSTRRRSKSSARRAQQATAATPGTTATRRRARRIEPPMVVAAQQWKAKHPKGNAKQCQEDLIAGGWPRVALRAIGWAMRQRAISKRQKVVAKSAGDASPPQCVARPQVRRRRSSPREETGRTPPGLDAAIRMWFRENPNGAYSRCRDAMIDEGFQGVTRDRVGRVVRAMTQARSMPPISVMSTNSPPGLRQQCPSCGIVAGRYGECRCG